MFISVLIMELSFLVLTIISLLLVGENPFSPIHDFIIRAKCYAKSTYRRKER